MKRLLFIAPYPGGCSPSQRFRFEQYFPVLTKQGFEVRMISFLDESDWKLFYRKGQLMRKAFAIIRGTARRLTMLTGVHRYDFVFIHREALPFGPPVLEWLIARCFRRRVIYDFDDAIWTTDRSGEGFWVRFFKYRKKVSRICTWAYKVSCGNEYLCQYAAFFNSQTVLTPTVVNTDNQHNPEMFSLKKTPGRITIGWTGSHSTLKYLYLVKDVLEEIERDHPHIEILVIADQEPGNLGLSSLRYREWNPDTEIVDLLGIDIGIMPLPDDEWAKGKCGFKAIQYMALGIPAVVSPVGVNNLIIQHGVNGFLAADRLQWYAFLKELIRDEQLRSTMGLEARKKISDNYSVRANSSAFLALFE